LDHLAEMNNENGIDEFFNFFSPQGGRLINSRDFTALMKNRQEEVTVDKDQKSNL